MSVPIKYLPRSLNEDFGVRPSTISAHELSKGLKRKTHTSLKVLSRAPHSSMPKDLDKDLLFKIKPKHVNIDKEQLFQENMQLKLQSHALQEELVKLRTKYTQIEHELNKKDKLKENSGSWDRVQSVSLTQNLKQSIKDLKSNLENKEKEIFKLRSNLRCSRTNELEAELQAYVDECTRLRHHLEETIKSNSDTSNQDYLTAQALDSLQADKSRLESLNKTLQTELNDLKSSIDEEKKRKKMIVRKVDVNQRSEIQKLKLALQGRERELKEKEKEFKEIQKDFKEKEDKLRGENSNLKTKLENSLAKLKQNPGTALIYKPSAPAFFRIISACVSKLKGLKEFLEGVKVAKSISQIFEYVKGLYPQVKQSHIMEIMDLFKLKKPENLYEVIKEWFYLYDYTPENPEFEHEVSKSAAKLQKSETKGLGMTNTKSSPIKAINENKSPKKEEKKENSEDIQIKKQVVIKTDEKKEELKTEEFKDIDLKKEDFKETSEKISIAFEEKPEPLSIKEEQKTPKSSNRPRKSSNRAEPEVQPIKTETDLPSPSSKFPKNSKSPENIPKSSKSEGKRPVTKAGSRKPKNSSIKYWEKLAMSLQIHRLSRSELINFFPEELPKKSLIQIFTSEPFNFTSQDSQKFTKSIFSKLNQKKLISQSEFISLFEQNSENWPIFSQEQEDAFNDELSEIVEKFKDQISEFCTKIDSLNSGLVTIEEFEGILESLKISLSPDLWKYTKLLFYSCNEELDQVPYVYFLDNYGKEENELDENDQEIASKVRNYIEKIAEKLIEANLTVAEVFKHTAGFIYPKEFEAGLEKLGIKDVPIEDFELMIQALQDEDSDEPCVLLEELADILNNYGVPEDAPGTLVENSLYKDEGGLKLENDEENYQDDYEEYSEDSNA